MLGCVRMFWVPFSISLKSSSWVCAWIIGLAALQYHQSVYSSTSPTFQDFPAAQGYDWSGDGEFFRMVPSGGMKHVQLGNP